MKCHVLTRQTGTTISSLLLMTKGALLGLAQGYFIVSFGNNGQLVFDALVNDTNYNYRVEWAPKSSGPWSEFGSSGAYWLDSIQATQGARITNDVPMFYRVVATPGNYICIDLSGGANATSYPVTYYKTLADVPNGPKDAVYNTTNILMRLIPKGNFTMGSPTNEIGRDSDETQHFVTLSKDYYIGVFEVTQRQWELVMGDNPSGTSTLGAEKPVNRVSYFDIRENPEGLSSDDPEVYWPSNNAVNASSFMGRLRSKTGLANLDLPTEAQWEYACRAGTATALNSGKNLMNDFSCPNMLEVGSFNMANGGPGLVTVGSYIPNARGLYDMHGNVREWCLDWYAAYSGNAVDPTGPGTSTGTRVLRGGGFYYWSEFCRSSARDTAGGVGDARTLEFGFRIAASIP